MSEHDKIRGRLALAVAGLLTNTEEKPIAEHVRSCPACANELGVWQSIATDLRRLPTPQPPSRLVQATLERAGARLAERAEHDWDRRVMILVVVFSWLLIAASWPAFHFVSNEFGRLFGLQLGRTWISFTAFTGLTWIAAGVAAVMLAVRQRRERRLV